MKVHDSLLIVHKCARGEYNASQPSEGGKIIYVDNKFSEDPHVNLFKLVFVCLLIEVAHLAQSNSETQAEQVKAVALHYCCLLR